MIDLIYQSGSVLLYKIEDWQILRNEYRILGDFLGSTQYVPVLPLRLSFEEALLLLNKDIARIVKCNDIISEPDNDIHTFNESTKRLIQEEVIIYKNIQKKRIAHYVDKIIHGKKKRGDMRSRDEILEEELQKQLDITEENMIWPIQMQTEYTKDKMTAVPTDDILQFVNPTKMAVYRDLWEKGYYITSGIKFGGDFLVYLGDPIMYHAMYIIKCLENEQETMHITELIAFGRMGHGVKKRTVLATVTNNETKYVTINWMEN